MEKSLMYLRSSNDKSIDIFIFVRSMEPKHILIT